MKRPRIFCFVAAWCCLALLTQVNGLVARPMKAYQAAGETIPMLWYNVEAVGFAVVAWLTVGLVQMRRFYRWFAVVFFVWWGIVLIWNARIVLHHPNVKPLRAALAFSLFVALNLSSAWYLCRRRFREFAVQFVAEHDKEKISRMMQKIAQEKVLDDIRR